MLSGKMAIEMLDPKVAYDGFHIMIRQKQFGVATRVDTESLSMPIALVVRKRRSKYVKVYVERSKVMD